MLGQVLGVRPLPLVDFAARKFYTDRLERSGMLHGLEWNNGQMFYNDAFGFWLHFPVLSKLNAFFRLLLALVFPLFFTGSMQ